MGMAMWSWPISWARAGGARPRLVVRAVDPGVGAVRAAKAKVKLTMGPR